MEVPWEGAHETPDDDMFKHLATSFVRNVKEDSDPVEPEPVIPHGTQSWYCPPLRKTFDHGIINGAKWQQASGKKFKRPHGPL